MPLVAMACWVETADEGICEDMGSPLLKLLSLVTKLFIAGPWLSEFCLFSGCNRYPAPTEVLFENCKLVKGPTWVPEGLRCICWWSELPMALFLMRAIRSSMDKSSMLPEGLPLRWEVACWTNWLGVPPGKLPWRGMWIGCPTGSYD